MLTRISLAIGMLALAFGSTAELRAQSPTDEVTAAVHALFDAMREADGPAADALFHPDGRLQTVDEASGSTVLRNTPADAFVQAVGSARTEVWDERISDLEVRVDGGLATAWMNYTFYLDDRLSHCGVNAMQFIRSEGGWQIFQITDTRRMEGCPELPPTSRR